MLSSSAATKDRPSTTTRPMTASTPRKGLAKNAFTEPQSRRIHDARVALLEFDGIDVPIILAERELERHAHIVEARGDTVVMHREAHRIGLAGRQRDVVLLLGIELAPDIHGPHAVDPGSAGVQVVGGAIGLGVEDEAG